MVVSADKQRSLNTNSVHTTVKQTHHAASPPSLSRVSRFPCAQRVLNHARIVIAAIETNLYHLPPLPPFSTPLSPSPVPFPLSPLPFCQQELDATAEKLTAQLRAARRRREELEAQVATLRAQQRLATKAAWSPPSVGDSSGYESCGMDDEGTSAVVPDTLSAVVDDDRAVLPSFTDTVTCMSAPAWGAKTKGGRMGAAPNGIDLLMLLASAGAQYAPGAAMADVDADAYAYAYADGAAQGGRRHARKPARFM